MQKSRSSESGNRPRKAVGVCYRTRGEGGGWNACAFVAHQFHGSAHRARRRIFLVARRAGRGEGYPPPPPSFAAAAAAACPTSSESPPPFRPTPRLFLRHLHLLGRFCRLRARRRAVCSSSFRQCAVRRRSRTTCFTVDRPRLLVSRRFLLPFARLLLHLLTLPPLLLSLPPPPPPLHLLVTDRVQQKKKKGRIRDRGLVSSRPVAFLSDDSLSLSQPRERGRGREVARTCRIPFLIREMARWTRRRGS